MFGISYGELFVILGATVALIGPKDLPAIARMAGRITGRGVGYFMKGKTFADSIVNKSTVAKETQEIKQEFLKFQNIMYQVQRASTISMSPLSRVVDSIPSTSMTLHEEMITTKQASIARESLRLEDTVAATMNLNAVINSKLAAAQTAQNNSQVSSGHNEETSDGVDLFTVLPVSAESAGLLPERDGEAKGSDIILEAVVEAEVANHAKQFHAQAKLPEK